MSNENRELDYNVITERLKKYTGFLDEVSKDC